MKTNAWLAAVSVDLGTCVVDRPLAQQRSQASDNIEVPQLHPSFYMIAGAGGNIAVQIGQDGVVVVDIGSSARTAQVLAEVQKLSKQPIRYIINTSADPDQVGGNEKLSAAGPSIIPTGGLNDSRRPFDRLRVVLSEVEQRIRRDCLPDKAFGELCDCD